MGTETSADLPLSLVWIVTLYKPFARHVEPVGAVAEHCSRDLHAAAFLGLDGHNGLDLHSHREASMGLNNNPALVLALSIVFGCVAVTAAAQIGDERSRSVRFAALNQLGILEYCQARGLVDEIVVSAQREMIQRLSGSSAANTVASLEEESGRAGHLAFGERQGRFEESAMAQGLTLKTACEIRAAIAPARGSR